MIAAEEAAAGNTVVLKPAETTPESTLVLARLAGRILPAGVLNVLLGDASTGALTAGHRTPAMVAVTGSVRAGRAVAAAATRVLVQGAVHDEFVRLLARAARDAVTGDPDEAKNLYGPLNNAEHFGAVCRRLAELPAHATVVTGGWPVAGAGGYFFEPTVVTGVHQCDALVQEETFAPVLTVQLFATEDEAVEPANGVDYAPASSAWTTDHGTAMRVSRELDFGCVRVNTHLLMVSEMPHGGFKSSGHGTDLSLRSVAEYTRVEHVMHALGDRGPQPGPGVPSRPSAPSRRVP